MLVRTNWRGILSAIRHILPTEHPKCEHFLRRKPRTKFPIKIASCRFCDPVAITLLHLVVDNDGSLAYRPIHLCFRDAFGHRICTCLSVSSKRIRRQRPHACFTSNSDPIDATPRADARAKSRGRGPVSLRDAVASVLDSETGVELP